MESLPLPYRYTHNCDHTVIEWVAPLVCIQEVSGWNIDTSGIPTEFDHGFPQFLQRDTNVLPQT